MLTERKDIVREADIMPSLEAQREASEVIVGWREAIVVADENGATGRFRVHNNYRVFVGGVDEGFQGKVLMEDEQDYPYKIAGKSVSIRPLGFEEGRKRVFEVLLEKGLRIVEPSMPEVDPEVAC